MPKTCVIPADHPDLSGPQQHMLELDRLDIPYRVRVETTTGAVLVAAVAAPQHPRWLRLEGGAWVAWAHVVRIDVVED